MSLNVFLSSARSLLHQPCIRLRLNETSTLLYRYYASSSLSSQRITTSHVSIRMLTTSTTSLSPDFTDVTLSDLSALYEAVKKTADMEYNTLVQDQASSVTSTSSATTATTSTTGTATASASASAIAAKEVFRDRLLPMLHKTTLKTTLPTFDDYLTAYPSAPEDLTDDLTDIAGTLINMPLSHPCRPTGLSLALRIFWMLGERPGSSGDNARYSAAQLMRLGLGCHEPDTVKATLLFHELADKKVPHAVFCLAEAYYMGRGTEQDYTEARKLFMEAADLGIVSAYKMLADIYLHGYGVDVSEEKAKNYLESGATVNCPHSNYALGVHYDKGTCGIEKDDVASFKHFNAAAARGLAPARYNTGLCYYTGKGVELDYAKALEHFGQAAMAGFVPALVNLGTMYYNGQGVPANKEEAIRMYELAVSRDPDEESPARKILNSIIESSKNEGEGSTGKDN